MYYLATCEVYLFRQGNGHNTCIFYVFLKQERKIFSDLVQFSRFVRFNLQDVTNLELQFQSFQKQVRVLKLRIP